MAPRVPIWKSRKFWLAVFAVVQSVVLYYFNVPKEIWTNITTLVMVLIVGIAVEDAGAKSGGGGDGNSQG
jgi:hypothetical protein